MDLCQGRGNGQSCNIKTSAEDSKIRRASVRYSLNNRHLYDQIVSYQTMQLVQSFHIRNKASPVLLADLDLVGQDA